MIGLYEKLGPCRCGGLPHCMWAVGDGRVIGVNVSCLLCGASTGLVPEYEALTKWHEWANKKEENVSREQELEALLHYHQTIEQDYHDAIAKANAIATRWADKAARWEQNLKEMKARLDEGYPVDWEPVEDCDYFEPTCYWEGGHIRIYMPEDHAIFRRIRGKK